MGHLTLTIEELHNLLVKKEITPLSLLEEVLDAIKNDDNNAFEYVCEKEAREFAASLGEPEVDNYLWGIPYVAKDNFSTKDIPTTGSSNILKGYVPVFDATVVKKLADKKAVLVGKSTLDELAMGGTGTSGHLGMTYNPWDETHTRLVGGSSCGSAAVTCAPIVPFALGSDTGDSVRKPASYDGLVGIKPTWGRISRYGLFPFATSLDHVGYFTRCVKDSAILLNVLAGRDELDSTSSIKPVDDYTSRIDEGLKGKKFVVINEIVDSLSDKNIKNSFDSLVENIKKAGATVTYKSMRKDLLESLLPIYYVISCAEATSNNANMDGIKFGPYFESPTYQEEIMNARTNGFGELIRRRFVIGSFSLMSENQDELFLRAQKGRRLIVNNLLEVMDGFDGLIVPAAPSIAPHKNDKSDKMSDEYLIADNHMALGNFAGLPSITVPMCMINGFPVGVNIMSHAFEEATLFVLAKGVEDITGLKNLNAKEGK